jgi:hypothetical protein
MSEYIKYEDRDGFLLVNINLRVYDIDGTLRIEFKDKNQIKNIFGKPVNKINEMDYMWFTDAHKGTKYHANFESDYPELIGKFTDDEKYDILGSIVGGTYSFINFSLPADINVYEYINTTYPEY